jgi:hypothetical protein
MRGIIMKAYDFFDRFLSAAGILLAVLVVATVAGLSVAVFAEHQEYRVYDLTCNGMPGKCGR